MAATISDYYKMSVVNLLANAADSIVITDSEGNEYSIRTTISFPDATTVRARANVSSAVIAAGAELVKQELRDSNGQVIVGEQFLAPVIKSTASYEAMLEIKV